MESIKESETDISLRVKKEANNLKKNKQDPAHLQQAFETESKADKLCIKQLEGLRQSWRAVHKAP